ncbi:general substrate transporter [Zychaea mexicana]|uniref:general substrate transporter n=1 Tax=Zychaea mexicana TaxID=64656 RepID=UPI0022FEA3E4|nr:general substrate transporter [Zychaea mexicana]KAI9491200.1 general substrate transporter [Zychaea mexicana]
MLKSLQIANYLRGNNLVIAINSAAGLSIFFFGYDQGVMSGVNIAPDYKTTMGLWDNEALLGGIVAVYYAGTLIGALMGGYVGDKIGRIKCVVVGCIFAVFGAALQTAATNVPWMICSRIITGIGTGHLNAIVPVWSAETSHHTSRGMFIAMEFTLNIFGVVVAYWIAYGLNSHEGGFRWRFPIGFQLIPLLVLAVFINIFPESPRWLVKKGRTEEALNILAALRGDGDVSHPNVTQEYEEIKETLLLEEKQGGEPNYWDMLFKYDEFNIPRRVHLSIWLQIIQELTGIGVITVYAPESFANAGFSERTSQLLSGCNNVSYMLCTLVAVFTLDRWGRRFTLFYGAVFQGISLILVAVLTKPDLVEMNPTAFGIAAAVFIFSYTAFFGMTWLTVPWLYPVEIYPLRVRARGGAWSVVGWSIGNAVVMEITPPMLAGIGWATFLLFGALNFLAIPVVWAMYPETMNKTLEELDVIFSTRSLLVWNAEKELLAKGIDPNDPLATLAKTEKAQVTASDTEPSSSSQEKKGSEKMA